ARRRRTPAVAQDPYPCSSVKGHVTPDGTGQYFRSRSNEDIVAYDRESSAIDPATNGYLLTDNAIFSYD
ncbi:hypothetical protein, partial [Kocuria atrinae]|uniref:hypothetical protein n=1 Tax=Kocuria atrinae TaxID=592377 RepID=UPI001CB96ED7